MNCNTTRSHPLYFYSRPCGRGDWIFRPSSVSLSEISTHAPAGGATLGSGSSRIAAYISTHAPAGGATRTPSMRQANRRRFLLTPLREGRLYLPAGILGAPENFYSRPCGRGDGCTINEALNGRTFLLTPLREGRHVGDRADQPERNPFLLTPLREGRPVATGQLYEGD